MGEVPDNLPGRLVNLVVRTKRTFHQTTPVMAHRWLCCAVLVAGGAAGVLIGSPAAAAGVLPVVVSPTSVDFGVVQIGATAAASVVVTATSYTQFTAIDGGTGNAAFTSSNNCTTVLHTGEACRFVYTFTPPTLGLFTATASFRLQVLPVFTTTSLSR